MAPRQRLGDLLWTLPFVVLFLLQLAHHQLWRDELNAFGIAAASPAFSRLLFYVHYEGHPVLWYALLWLTSKITVYPVGMQVLEGVIGTCSYLVIGLASPFTRVQKLLLFLCYFVSFEYSVMSRMYSLMLLFMLLYLRRRAAHPQRVAGNAALLGLIAATDVTGMVLSFALLCEFGWSVWRGTVQVAPTSSMRTRKLASGLLIYGAMTLISAYTLLPSKDLSARTTGKMFAYATSLHHLILAVVGTVVVPYFPTLTGHPHHFWDPEPNAHAYLFSFGTLLVLAAYWLLFRRHPNILLMLAVSAVLIIGFSHLVYMGSTRQFGVTFLAYLAGLWLLRSRGERLPAVAYILLGLTALGGIDAGIESWQHPFSNAEAAAGFLRRHNTAHLPLVGSPDTSAAGVAELLHSPIYMLDCNCSSTFLLFSKRRDDFSLSEIPARLVTARASLHAPAFFYVGIVPFTPAQRSAITSEGFAITPLAHFTGAEAWQEDFYIYEFESGSVSGSLARNSPLSRKGKTRC